MKAPRIPPAKDSLAAAAVAPAIHPEPIVNDPAEALYDVTRQVSDVEATLYIVGDAIFQLDGGARAFSATETLRRELKSIEALLEGISRVIRRTSPEGGA